MVSMSKEWSPVKRHRNPSPLADTDRIDRLGALNAADALISDRARNRARRGHLCPICGRDHWCLHGHGVALCPREARGALLDRNGQPIRMGRYGYLHLVDRYRLPMDAPPRRPTPRSKVAPADVGARFADLTTFPDTSYHQKVSEVVWTRHCAALGLPRWAIEAVGGRLAGAELVCPERDASGRTIGYQTRTLRGYKENGTDTARGCNWTPGWREQAIATGFLAIVEGFTDLAACQAMNILAICRPGAEGGVPIVSKLVEGLPATVRVVVVAERDSGTGRTGNLEMAEAATKTLGHRVEAAYPPDEAKDTRAWLIAQRLDLTDTDALHAAGRRFIAGLVPVPVEPEGMDAAEGPSTQTVTPQGETGQCTSCSIDEESPNRASRTKPTLPRYDYARCPRCGGVVQRHVVTPGKFRWAGGPCRSRSCPSCGPIWVARHELWFAWCVSTADKPLYASYVRRKDWQRVYRRLHRAGADYVAIEVMPDVLNVVSTLPCSDASAEIGAEEADYALRDWVKNARPVLRPILTSVRWRLPTKDPDEEEEAGDGDGKREEEPEENSEWVTIGRTKGKTRQNIVTLLRFFGVKPDGAKDWEEDDSVHGMVEWTAPPGDTGEVADWIINGSLDRPPLLTGGRRAEP